MVNFLKGLEPSIAKKVDIQPYWMFEDICKLANKVEKYSKNVKVYGSSNTKPTILHKKYLSPKPNKEMETKTNVKPLSRNFLSS